MAYNQGLLLSNLLLSNNLRIPFSQTENPHISIVIVSYNAPEMLALTLCSLSDRAKYNRCTFELIVVDNDSRSDTRAILELVDNAKIILNNRNEGYGTACNIGAKQAKAKYVLFLNPDVETMPGCLDALVQTIESSESIACVGGKLIWPGGELQEAGAMMLNDAQITYPYKRHGNPNSPEASFRRATAYVSGALLLTKKETFEELNGFDPCFSPAYFEDTDYCIRAWRAGYEVIYEPDAVAHHFESATSKNRAEVDRLLDKNREIFRQRHSKWLFNSAAPKSELRARDFRNPSLRVLVVDDQVPHQDQGAGFPRMNNIVKAMVGFGYQVSLYPLYRSDPLVSDRYRDIPREVEILGGQYGESFADILINRQKYYDVLWVSRPHNISYVMYEMSKNNVKLRDFVESTVIFDCEAIYTLRDQLKSLLDGKIVYSDHFVSALKIEVASYEIADCIISVSENETVQLKRLGLHNAVTLGHSATLINDVPSHSDRKDVLFLGSMHSHDTPNADSVRWFLDHIWPLVQKDLGPSVRFNIVGHIDDDLTREFASKGANVIGRVPHISEYFSRSRVMVAPTRFAAGIPLKVYDAIAHGLPVVLSTVLKSQIGWREGSGFISANWSDVRAFADGVVRLYTQETFWGKVQQSGRGCFIAECAPTSYQKKIRTLCESAHYSYIRP